MDNSEYTATSTRVSSETVQPARKAAISDQLLSAEELRKIDAYWRAANYLSVGQIYLYKNPLLREPLKLEHIKPRLLGHWGTTPGLNFIYVHLNRISRGHATRPTAPARGIASGSGGSARRARSPAERPR